MKHLNSLVLFTLFLYACFVAPGLYAQDTTLTITGTGNVGIGKTNPSYKLDVKGAVNAESLLVNGVAVGTDGGGNPWLPSGSGIYYNSGNVSIGTSSPTGKLDVLGSHGGRFIVHNLAGNFGEQLVAEVRGFGSLGPLLRFDNDFPGAVNIGLNPDGNFFIGNAITTNLDGNVGIGTSAPANKLDVEGGAVIGSSYSGTNLAPTNGLLVEGKVGIGTVDPPDNLSIQSSGQGEISIRSSVGNNSIRGQLKFGTINPTYHDQWAGIASWSEGGADQAALSFYTSYGTRQERIFISATGRVGIGTNSPDQLLSVNGGASKVGGGSWSVFSDRRLKQDINSFEDGLSVIKRIMPVTFRYNGKLGYPTDKTYVGVIAQDIQTVAPYTVDIFKAKLNPGDAEETDILRFDPNALTYISINAIKELSTENQKLHQELDELKSMVTSLTAKISGSGDKSMGDLR